MIRIGITGHRPHRLKVPETKLAARVAMVLTALIEATGEPVRKSRPLLDIISPLAEGCDRIVAQRALALHQHVTALLPFKRRDYEATFADASTTKEFRRLWKASGERTVLNGLAKNAEASYVAVGMVTLARSDLILTIWDGQPAQGRGGTPEILQSALVWGIPIIWIHATEDRAPLFLTASGRSSSASLELETKEANPLNPSTYRALVARVSHKN